MTMCKQKGFLLLLWVIMLSALPLGTFAQEKLNKKVSVNVKQATVESVLSSVKKQTGLSFVYNAEQAKSWPKISLNETNRPASEVLDRIVALIGCSYEMKNDIVTIYKQRLSGNERTVRGYVRDENGEELIGALVSIGEGQLATVTDAEGFYTLNIPTEKTILKFSYVGMDNVYQTVNAGQTDITRNVTMESGMKLDDVVVTGYYSQAKNSFTGAARTISQEELQAGSNQNILTALKNIDPSFVMVENNSRGSDPNQIPDFTIRGTGSIPNMRDQYNGNPNMPLFIVDGFETTVEKVFDMDPYRVKNITLLKDAAATAIYGSRASNGVVVITTNTPAAGKLAVSYNIDITSYVPDLSSYNLCNAEQKLALEKAAGLYDVDKKYYIYENRISDDYWFKQAYLKRQMNILQGIDTDWLAQPLDQVAIGHKHSLRIDGGSDNIRYAMDLNYANTPGVMKKSNREHMGIGLELQYIYKNITFRNQLLYSNIVSNNSPYGNFADYTKMNPYVKIKDEEGHYLYAVDDIGDRDPGYSTLVYSPLFNSTLKQKNENSYDDLTNLFGIDWEINDGLRLRSTFAFTRQHTESDIFKSALHTDFANYTAEDYDRRGSYTASRGNIFNLDGSIVMSYYKQFDNHVINMNLGWNAQQQQQKIFSVVAEGFPNDNLDYISFATQYEKGGSPSGDEYISRLMGFLGNINYSLKNRYLFDLSFREDASSRFGSNKRWAPFWSVGIGWNMHNEEFIKNRAQWLSELKLRATYGLTGSQEYDPYQAMTTYRYLTADRYHYAVGSVLMAMGNENLTWQRTIQKNLGVDMALLNNGFEVSFDYYIKTSKDLLTAATMPPSLGFSTYMANLGEVENKGWELAARLQVVKLPSQRLFWSVNGSIIHNKNRLLKISESLRAYNDTQDSNTTGGSNATGANIPKVRFVEGESINSIWVNKSLGIDPLTGKEIFVDKNGNTTTEWSSENYVIGGCSDPNLEGLFGTTFSWRGWQLTAQFAYRIGGQMYNQTLVDKVQDADPKYNVDLRAFTERWQKPGDTSRFSGYTNSFGGINTYSTTKPTSRFVEDYNYLQMSSLNISYEFNNAILSKWGIKRLKLLFYMNDVFHTSSVHIERGTSYPYARNFSISAQVRF